uniref:PHD-type domain-containing protein n=1 Tax=Caenorhabditis tropicalis TaxID=1561998 RepID=A0A1I7U0C7_9PELO
MTSTRPKRNVRNATPAPPVEDDDTIVRDTLNKLIFTVDVNARYEQTQADIAAFHRGDTTKTMAQVMMETRWHELAAKAMKDCPLGSTAKRKKYESEEESDEENPNVMSTPTKNQPKPKSAPSTPSKAKLAAMKRKADAEKRKAQREAKKLEAMEKEYEDFAEMPILEIEQEIKVDEPESQKNEVANLPVVTEEDVKIKIDVAPANEADQMENTSEIIPSPTNTVESSSPPQLQPEAPAATPSNVVAPDPPSQEPCTSNFIIENREPELQENTLSPAVKTDDDVAKEKYASRGIPYRVFHPDIHEPDEIEYTPEEVARAPWLAKKYNTTYLYPFEFGQLYRDQTPGRTWYTPYSQPLNTFEVFEGIGPWNELMNLDMHARIQLISDITPEQANLINKRVLELLIPYYRKKLEDPETTQKDRQFCEQKLTSFLVVQRNIFSLHERLRYRTVALPDKPLAMPPEPEVIQYSKFDPCWYTSSRYWCDKSDRQQNQYLHKAFLEQFRDCNNTFILQFQKSMLDKAKKIMDPVIAERYRRLRLPVVRNINLLSHVRKQQMNTFREKLALYFQYEDFEKMYMTDPACRELMMKLAPQPAQAGVIIEHAVEEFSALLVCYKKRFGLENPVIPLPRAEDEMNPTDDEIRRITERCLADVIDTVVLRELGGIPTFPHRVPVDSDAI